MFESKAIKFYDSPKKNVLITDGFGKVTPDDIRWMKEELRRRGRETGGKWAWIAIIYNMDPIIDPECQKVFAEVHEMLEKEGCVALAYVAGGSVAIKVQAQRHRLQAKDNVVSEYFRTTEDALEWLADF